MNEQEHVSPPPEIEDMIRGFQYETTVEVPGHEGRTHRVTLGLLWEDETRLMQIEIGRRISPNDYVARELETRFETVVRAVVSIDDWKTMVSSDEAEHRARRAHLRRILSKQPRLVSYLYDEYLKIESKRDRDYDARIDEIKKSSRTQEEPDLPEEDIHTPSSSTSGEDGGS